MEVTDVLAVLVALASEAEGVKDIEVVEGLAGPRPKFSSTQ